MKMKHEMNREEIMKLLEEEDERVWVKKNELTDLIEKSANEYAMSDSHWDSIVKGTWESLLGYSPTERDIT